MKYFKTSCKIYLTHISVMLIAFFLMMLMYSSTQKHPYLFYSLTTVIYLAAMYSVGWRVGRADSRKIPGYYPDKKAPAVISLITAVVPLILLIIIVVAPGVWHIDLDFVNGGYDFFIPGCRVNGTPDMIYRLWFFAFAAFVPCGNIIAYIAELFVMPIMIFVGYFVGLKKFSIIEYLYMRVVFSGKNNSKKENSARR